MTSDRRQFVKLASTVALASYAKVPLFAASAKTQIPLAFSTLGCPAWEWGKILNFAQQHGFAAIELRGILGNMDLPSLPIFASDQIATRKSEIAAHKLQIASVSSSANLYYEEPDKRAKELADARRFIDLAGALGARYVRVFGGKAQSDNSPAPSDAVKARVASALRELGTYAAPHQVTVIIESHDHFTSSVTLKDVMRAANSDHAGILWDAHHTFATSNEEPEYTVKELGKWIRHTHLKDSTGTGEDRKYVLTGRGNVPIGRQIEALQSIGYKGFYCFEWEKVWHPDIAEPEIAIPDFARVVGQCKGNRRACGLD
jgi:sugar phosphate isomerase/epimerase